MALEEQWKQPRLLLTTIPSALYTSYALGITSMLILCVGVGGCLAMREMSLQARQGVLWSAIGCSLFIGIVGILVRGWPPVALASAFMASFLAHSGAGMAISAQLNAIRRNDALSKPIEALGSALAPHAASVSAAWLVVDALGALHMPFSLLAVLGLLYWAFPESEPVATSVALLPSSAYIGVHWPTLLSSRHIPSIMLLGGAGVSIAFLPKAARASRRSPSRSVDFPRSALAVAAAIGLIGAQRRVILPAFAPHLRLPSPLGELFLSAPSVAIAMRALIPSSLFAKVLLGNSLLFALASLGAPIALWPLGVVVGAGCEDFVASSSRWGLLAAVSGFVICCAWFLLDHFWYVEGLVGFLQIRWLCVLILGCVCSSGLLALATVGSAGVSAGPKVTSALLAVQSFVLATAEACLASDGSNLLPPVPCLFSSAVGICLTWRVYRAGKAHKLGAWIASCAFVAKVALIVRPSAAVLFPAFALVVGLSGPLLMGYPIAAFLLPFSVPFVGEMSGFPLSILLGVFFAGAAALAMPVGSGGSYAAFALGVAIALTQPPMGLPVEMKGITAWALTVSAAIAAASAKLPSSDVRRRCAAFGLLGLFGGAYLTGEAVSSCAFGFSLAFSALVAPWQWDLLPRGSGALAAFLFLTMMASVVARAVMAIMMQRQQDEDIALAIGAASLLCAAMAVKVGLGVESGVDTKRAGRTEFEPFGKGKPARVVQARGKSEARKLLRSRLGWLPTAGNVAAAFGFCLALLLSHEATGGSALGAALLSPLLLLMSGDGVLMPLLSDGNRFLPPYVGLVTYLVCNHAVETARSWGDLLKPGPSPFQELLWVLLASPALVIGALFFSGKGVGLLWSLVLTPLAIFPVALAIGSYGRWIGLVGLAAAGSQLLESSLFRESSLRSYL